MLERPEAPGGARIRVPAGPGDPGDDDPASAGNGNDGPARGDHGDGPASTGNGNDGPARDGGADGADGLARELLELAARGGDPRRAELSGPLRALDDDRRSALVLRLVEHVPGPPEALLVPLLEGIAPDALPWRAARVLIDAVAARVTAAPEVLAALAAAAERATGACPPGLVAVMRRTALEQDRHGSDRYRAPLRPWLERTADRLNAGEPWAEAANAETPGPALLPHALAAAGARPAPRWTRAARSLLPAAGGDGARALIRRWLALVPRPRTIALRRHDERWDPNDVPDAYNARALRGLLYLLAVTPPHDDDPAAVSGLVQHCARKVPGHGPRSQMLALAGIHALERFSTVPALRELTRLRAATPPPGIAAALRGAIARRGVALGVDPARL